MSFSVDLIELDGLRDQIQRYGDFIKEEVAMDGVAAMAQVPYEAARMYAPVSEAAHIFYGRNSVRNGVVYRFEPGNLRRAIYRAFRDRESTATRKEYRVSWNHLKAPYGHMVEFGTATAPAHPFLGLALGTLPAAVRASKEAMAFRLKQYTRQR